MPTVKRIVDAMMCLDNKMSCSDCYYNYAFDGACASFAIIDAAESLKKLIPQKARRALGAVFCPNCGTDYSIFYYTYPIFSSTHYCPRCGQAIDWSEDNGERK